MPLSLGAGLVLIVLGAAAGAPGLLLIGVLVLLTVGLTGLWSRRGLRSLAYAHRLGSERAVVGDEVPLDLVLRNEKLLPLPFVRTEDLVSDDLVLREQSLARTDQPGLGAITEAWSVASFQQVVRHRHVLARQRGVFRFGPARVRVADLFGRTATSREDPLPATLVVRPPTVALRPTGAHRPAPGERPARRGLIEDPALFAGVRPFQPGDPLRRIHWRATARLGHPVSRRFDPAQTRTALVVVDVQTVEGPHWRMAYDEDVVESLIVAAGSLVRALLADGVACGLGAAAWTGTIERLAYLAPGSGPDQMARAADLLARLSPFASAPFELLLGSLPASLPRGASLHVLTGRDPSPYLAVLRRLRSGGAEVDLLCFGGQATAAASRARLVGLAAAVGRVLPDWHAPNAVEVAG
ncbi:MAG TPA: DUF58 domain-containing protein [Candidatus Limnocylindrales bacterium]|nr:DUF58 domain-containing protein [Candidatus Limnocylindrales bacterium]